MEKLIANLKRLFLKYKKIIMYGIFGVLTTILNIVTYWFCYDILHIPNIISNTIAWVVAIAVAFITNKLWVFDSKDTKKETVIAELVKFIIARVATGVIDLIIMFTAVDVMQLPAVIFKVIANVIVIILNYILSNILIFKKSDKTPAKKSAKKPAKKSTKE